MVCRRATTGHPERRQQRVTTLASVTSVTYIHVFSLDGKLYCLHTVSCNCVMTLYVVIEEKGDKQKTRGINLLRVKEGVCPAAKAKETSVGLGGKRIIVGH